jgi:hypothetical protein
MLLNLAWLDGVKTTLAAAAGASDTLLRVAGANPPWQNPPFTNGQYYYYLTLIDAEIPMQWERVKVTNVFYPDGMPGELTVERNIASSSGAPQAFAAGAILQWSPGAREIDHWRMSLSASMTAADGLAGTRFLAPFTGSVTGSMGAAYWINRSGKALRLSQLIAVRANDSTFSGDSIVVSVESTDGLNPAAPSGLQLQVFSDDFGIIRNAYDFLDIAPEGPVCFMLSRANAGASVSGAFRLAHVSVLAEEL